MSGGGTSSLTGWGWRIGGATVAAVIAMAAGVVPGARAAVYTVESCTSVGQPTAAGWQPSVQGQYAGADATPCAKGGAMQGFFDGSVEHSNGDRGNLHFFAPADTTLVSLKALRSAEAGPFRQFGNPVAQLQADGIVLEECQQFTKCSALPETPISFDLINARYVVFGAFCNGPAGCPAGSTAYHLRQVRLGLNDVASPVFTAPPTGSLTSSAPNLPKVRTLTYSASDQGGGVYRHRLLVDGAVALTETANANDGRCVLPFRDPVPCRTSPTGATVSFDTSGLSDGPHTVQLEVRDATDENRVATAPWTITVGGGSPVAAAPGGGGSVPVATPETISLATLRNPITEKVPNGIPPAADAVVTARFVIGSGSRIRSSTRLVAAYAQRARIRGTIQTPAGAPVVGARVYVVQKPLNGNVRTLRISTSAVTAADGSFTATSGPGGRSRDLRVVYFPVGGSDANRSSNPLTMQVRQDADLRVSRRTLRNRGRLLLTGRVLGTIPSGGVDVRMQVRLGASWFTFKKLTTTRSRGGHFRTVHRFTKTTRATTYRFRALVLPRNRTLNSTGFSRHIDVRVLP